MVQGFARNDAQARRLAGDLVGQWRITVAWLKELEPAAFDRASVLAAHTVRDLIGHLLLIAAELTDSLGRPTSRRPATLSSHLRTMANSSSRTHQMVRQTVGEDSGPALVRQLVAATGEMERALQGDLPPVVESMYEPARVTDLLRSTTIEVVQLSDDLAESLPEQQGLPLERGPLFTAVRTLAEQLAEAHPGRSLEVRVPPAAAVQIAGANGEGPTHTRGTPPGVVEMAPRIFLRLATGRLAWHDALDRHLVNASGVHADLSGALPVLRH